MSFGNGVYAIVNNDCGQYVRLDNAVPTCSTANVVLVNADDQGVFAGRVSINIL